MTAERELDISERQFWLDGGSDAGLGGEIIMGALESKPRRPELLIRAVQIAEHLRVAPGVSERIETELKAPAKRVREQLRLLDRLGDENLSPAEAVFDHLVPAVPRLDLTGLDPAALERSRMGAGTRPQAAKALLEAIGWGRLPEDVAGNLRWLVESLVKNAEVFQAHALLVRAGWPGLVLGVEISERPGSGVEANDNVQPDMEKQGRAVLYRYADQRKACWSLEWPLRYEGTSIGLSLAVGGLVRFENLPSDPLLAVTGEVTDAGVVKGVEGIEAKLEAARDAGFQRVLLPEDNQEDVERLVTDELPELLYVGHVDQIRPTLATAGAKSDFSLGGRTRFLRAALETEGLEVVADREIPHGWQLKVADAQSETVIALYAKRDTIRVQPQEVSAGRLAQQVVDRICGSPADRARDPRKWKVPPARRDQLEKALQAAGAQARETKGQSEQWRYLMQRPATKAQLTLWSTGTLMLQGEGEAFDEVLQAVERELAGLANVSVGPRKSKEPDLSHLRRDVPWAGTDESGKGDYFGPLVSAAVFVDAALAAQLEELGVQDSKKLSDARVHKLAPEIRRLLGNRYDLTPINPPRFNPFYSEMKAEGKNMNTLLAWGHARSIEDLIGKGMRPSYVIVDKFADARYMEQKLLADTREAGIELVQVTKAEADIAVAAASILAREAFLSWLDHNSASLGMRLPKGAGANVKEAARQIVATKGEKALGEYAKLFFKTTGEVLGR